MRARARGRREGSAPAPFPGIRTDFRGTGRPRPDQSRVTSTPGRFTRFLLSCRLRRRIVPRMSARLKRSPPPPPCFRKRDDTYDMYACVYPRTHVHAYIYIYILHTQHACIYIHTCEDLRRRTPAKNCFLGHVLRAACMLYVLSARQIHLRTIVRVALDDDERSQKRGGNRRNERGRNFADDSDSGPRSLTVPEEVSP